MEGVGLLLAAAAVGHGLARLLGLPVIPFLLAAGTGLSLLRPPGQETLQDALVLGAGLLLFLAGMELDPARFRAQRSAALRVGVWQFAALGVLGFVAATLLGYGPVEAGYLALALTASSTLVCVRLLKKRGEMFVPYGRLVVGTVAVQDALVLLSIPLVMTLGGTSGGGLRGVGALLLLGVAALGTRRWIAPLLQRVEDEEELVLLAALSILFLFTGAAAGLGLPLVVGAFLAGVSLSRFPVEEIVRVELAPVGDFFTALFFVALGALVRVSTATEILHAAALGAVVVAVTPPLVTWLAEREGFAARAAIEAGLMLSQTSEISLVIGLSGMVGGYIGPGTFTVIALFTGTTMLLTPFLSEEAVAWRLTRLHPSRWARRHPSFAAEGHLLLVGGGATGRHLLELLPAGGPEAVVMDEDPAILRRLRDAGVSTVRGDVSDPRALERAGLRRARAAVSMIPRPRDNAALLEATPRDTPVLVRVFDEEDGEWVRELGGTPVHYAEAATETLMNWYDRTAEELERRLRGRMAGASGATDAGRQGGIEPGGDRSRS